MNTCLVVAIGCAPVFALLSLNGYQHAHQVVTRGNWGERGTGRCQFMGFGVWLILDLVEIALLRAIQRRRARRLPFGLHDRILRGLSIVVIAAMLPALVMATTVA